MSPSPQLEHVLSQSNFEILESHKKLFRKNPYKIVFRLNFNAVSSRQIKDLLFLFTSSLGLQNKQTIRNLRGRPIESFPSNTKNLSKSGEEIVSIYGNAGIEDSDQNNDFCYSLATFFSEYSNQGEVIHSLKNKAFGVLTDFEQALSISKVCSWIPLRIDGFRFGAEHYEQFFLGSMLGAVPSVESRFYIEVDKLTAWVLIERNGSKDIFSSTVLKKLDTGLEETEIFKGLLATLRKQYGYNV